MPIVLCKGCGNRHEAMLVRCPLPRELKRVPSEGGVGSKKISEGSPKFKGGWGPETLIEGVPLTSAEHPKGPRGALRGKRIRKGSLEGVELPKEVRLEVAREIVEGDCTNPACPYREEVLGRRERHRDRVKAWREKRRGVGANE